MLFVGRSESDVLTLPAYPDRVLSEHFRLSEFRDRSGASEVKLHPDLIRGLEVLRARFGRPVIVHSGYRSAAHNAAVGGVEGSFHTKGMAADIHVEGVPHELVARVALSIFGGVGLYGWGVHVDVGPARYWVDPSFRGDASMFEQMARARVEKPSPLDGFGARWLENIGELVDRWLVQPFTDTAEAVRGAAAGLRQLGTGKVFGVYVFPLLIASLIITLILLRD